MFKTISCALSRRVLPCSLHHSKSLNPQHLSRSFSSQVDTNLSKTNGEFRAVLTSKHKISIDSYIYKFDLPYPDLPLGLLPGQHVIFHKCFPTPQAGGPPGELVSRKYTPISCGTQQGSIDFLIKIYGKTEAYPEGGKMSYLLDNLKVGEEVEMAGPVGRIIYHGDGKFVVERRPVQVDEIGCIVGGSGITPIYQIMQEIYNNPNDKTKIRVLFGNRAEEEILLRRELDELSKDNRIEVHYTIDKATSKDWKGFEGYITKDMIQKVFPAPRDNLLMTVCGNNRMRKLVFNLLEDLKYDEDLVARF